MANQDSPSKTRTPLWGAPAADSAYRNTQLQDTSIPRDELFQRSSSPNPHRYQRPGPYHNNSNRGRGISAVNSYQNNERQNHSPTFLNQGQNFSPSNPFRSQGQNFSSDNPFQSRGQNFSPGNPFQSKREFSSPVHPHARADFQTSPLAHTPGSFAFSPRMPNTLYRTPSPRGAGSQQRNNSDSSKRFVHRNTGLNNPGGSSNIQNYIHPSMLEDPWKDLPPTSVLQ